jgi:hypothetical protein
MYNHDSLYLNEITQLTLLSKLEPLVIFDRMGIICEWHKIEANKTGVSYR